MLEESYTSDGITAKRVVRINGHSFSTSIKADPETPDPSLSWWRSYFRGERPKPNAALTRQVRVIDLFSGCGGLALGVTEGMRAAGLSPAIELAADVDDDGLQVYSHNLKPKRVFHGSVTSLVDFQVFGQGEEAEFAYPPAVLNPDLEESIGKIDILCAGPPCQGHSNLNNHSRREDPRNLLYLSVPALAVGMGIPIVIIENVPEVTADRFNVVGAAVSLLKSAGYGVTTGVIHSQTLGCAQTRRRFFLIASKLGKPQELSDVLKAIQRPPVDLKWAIHDLRNVPAEGIMNTTPVMSPENQRRIDYLFDTEGFDLPNEVRPDCHKDGHTYGSVYGRLRWDKPSQTITTGFLTPGRGRYIHPENRRVLTPHEAARIQAFPDSFEFTVPNAPAPSRTRLTKWIGDAVPSVMGYAAALCAVTSMYPTKEK